MAALTKVEKDQRRGSKSRRKAITPQRMEARILGVALILEKLSVATQGRVSCSRDAVWNTVHKFGL